LVFSLITFLTLARYDVFVAACDGVCSLISLLIYCTESWFVSFDFCKIDTF